MSTTSHRYRITVTPIEDDGMQCNGRCTIEFEHACHDDWMRLLEAVQRQRGLSGDQRAALVVGTQLLNGLMLDPRKDTDDLFDGLRPSMVEFTRKLKQRSRDAG